MAYGASASTVLTLLGFCVSVIFIVYVCIRFACALVRRRRRRQRRAPPLPQYAVSPYVFALHHLAGHHPGAGGAAGGGLDPAAVAAFPTSAFARGPRDSGTSSDADAQCVVCLAEYEDKDMLRFLPYCGHNFHMACIDLWLEQNSTCPVCRISLRGNLDNTHITPPPSVVISPPCSPPAAGSDPCRCLFVSAGHSSRASEVPRHEPDQENQIASGPSVDGAANNLPLSEVNSPPENNSQTGRKQRDDRSTQLESCK